MRLPSILYLWGSALDVSDELVNQSKLSKTVMFTSSDRSWKVLYEGGNIKKESMEFQKSASAGKNVLGLMLEGSFSNIFEGLDMPEWPKKEEVPVAAIDASAAADNQAKDPQKQEPAQAKPKAVMENPAPGKLIIIGCARMFNDDLITNPGNLGLLSNIVDGLSIGSDIITIRSKSYVSRDIKKASDSQKVLYRFVAIFLVPLALIVFALMRLFLRRKEKLFYGKGI
jgi:hypothetical protein